MLSAHALACLLYVALCPGISVAYLAYEVDGSSHLTLENKLVRKERAELEDAAQRRTEAPGGDFDSTSGKWQQVRKKTKITAEEPFSAQGPPTVIYTSQTASAASTILMGMTTCFVGLFCLLQGAMQQVVWKTLNTSLSCFSALLLYYLVREITNLMVADAMVFEEVSLSGLRRLSNLPPAASSGPGAVIVAMLRFLLAFCGHQLILTNGRHRKILLSVSSTFGALLVGLLGADAFATFQETSVFTDSPGASLGLVCNAVVVMALLICFTTWLRNKVMTDPGQQECCRDSDCTVAAITISLPLIQFWRFVLAGRLPHFWGIQRSAYNRSETTYLFITLPVLIGVTILGQRGIKSFPGSGPLQTMSLSAVKTLAYLAAWCSFYWAKWLDHGLLMATGDLAPAGEVMKAELYSAIAFSAVTMGFAIASELSKEKLPQFEACFQLFCEVSCFAMSLAWNSCFQTACAFSKEVKASHFDQVFGRCTQCQWMCILLIPSWLIFILPRVTGDKADEKEGKDEKTAGEQSDQKSSEKEPTLADTASPGGEAPSAPEVPAEVPVPESKAE